MSYTTNKMILENFFKTCTIIELYTIETTYFFDNKYGVKLKVRLYLFNYMNVRKFSNCDLFS